MTMKLAVATLLSVLAFASPALASQYPSPSPDAFSFERRALAMAELKWHPACGPLTISWDARPAGEDGTGWAYESECVIHLDADSPELDYWEPLCTTVLHEAGHVVGREHTPRGIMRHDRVYSIMEARARATRSRTRGAAQPEWQTFVAGGDWRCDRSGKPWLQVTRRHEQARGNVVDPGVGPDSGSPAAGLDDHSD